MSHQGHRQRLVQVLGAAVLALSGLAAAPIGEELLNEIRSEPDSVAPPSGACSLAEGDVVARMTVPRLDLDLSVREGITDSTLARGAGHLSATALPGEEAPHRECVIAIARDPDSAEIGRLRLGESVRMTTPGGARTYRVAERLIVEPSDLRLGAAADPRILLWTPYPTGTLGPARHRLALVLEPVLAN